MSSSSSKANMRRDEAHSLPFSAWLITAMYTLIMPACQEETRNPGKRAEIKALDQTGVSLGYDEAVRPQTQAKSATTETGPILGQRTTEILPASNEIKQKSAQPVSPKIVARDPITIQGNAYVSIVGQAAIGNMKHAVDLFYAENDRYPKDYEEFMSAIVRSHGISLPQLPLYRKYAYNENEHKLIILEYPDLKN